MEVGSAFLSLMLSTRGFGASTERQIGPQMTGVAKRTGSRFGKVFAYSSMSPLKAIGAAAVGLFAVQKVKEFFGSAIDEARESQKVSALTAQVIKSTGGAAGISAKQIGDMAGRLSMLTGVDDEAIQGGENLLLTFKNVKDFVAGQFTGTFTDATGVMLDMSVALDQDMKSSAIQVGKALNDPIKGITALSRVGVSFTEQQKAQIKTLVESGNVTKAQSLILKELKSEFGGAAQAAATSGDKFKTAFANLQESVGLALLPQLDKLLDKGTVLIGWLIAKVPPAFAAFKAAVAPVAQVIGDFISNHLEAFKTALAALGGSALTSVISLIGGGLVSAIGVLVGALASPIALIGALVGAAIYAYTHFESFRTTVDNLAASFKTNILPALIDFGGFLRDQVLPAVVAVGKFMLTEFYPTMLKAWAVVAQKLKPVFDQLVSTFRSDVMPVLTQVAAKLREWWPTIQQVVQVVAKLYGKWLEFAASIAGKVLPVVIRFAGFLLSNVVPAIIKNIEVTAKIISKIIEFGGAVVDTIKDVARFVQGVKEKFNEALNFVKSIPGKMISALRTGIVQMVGVGKDLIAGLLRGIQAAAQGVVDAAKHVAQSAIDAAKGVLHIGSPSKVFDQMGRWTIEGLVNGLLAVAPAAIAAAAGAADKVRSAVLARLTSMRDGVKSLLDGLRSDFDSLKSSVVSAFTGDLFSATSMAEFGNTLGTTMTNLQALVRAFKKLVKWGLPANFLSALFASGNSALILDMAAGTRGDAQASANTFQAINNLGNMLGGQVARNDIGPKIDKTNERLERIEKAIKHIGKDVGDAVNGAAANGHRRAS